MTNKELVEAAYKAMENAYVPYSKFQVGAALITEDGTLFTGCNIENSSYGATNCAERTAMFKMVSEGHRSFKKMAVVSNSKKYTYPCGICRQVMGEFAMDAVLVFDDEEKGIIEIPVSEILPYKFEM